jgi:phage terminase large subunit
MGRTVRDGRCTCLIEYGPLPSQARFHRSQARFKGFSGPIGSGKSRALCHEALKLSYLNAGRTGLIGAPTYAMLRDTTQAALLEVLEANSIPYGINKSENVLVIKDTRSKILFRSLEEYERLRGTNLAWFGVDELTYSSEEAWLRLEGRLRDPQAKRLCGFAVWTPKGHDWVYKRFIDNPAGNYETVIARPMENRYILEKVPDFYERLKRSYDERFYRQEVLGEYLAMHEGRVYPAFERGIHIRDVEPDPERHLLWALDFNVDPMSSVIAQIDEETVYVLDEIVLSRASTWEACLEFQNRYPPPKKGLRIYADASGQHRQTGGGTDIEIIKRFLSGNGYRRVEYRLTARNPAVRDRVGLVNARLKNAAGEVRLYVHSRCRELIRDFEEVTYKPGSGVIDKERDSKRTHVSDALGYLIWREFGQPFGPAGEQDKPLLPS